MLDQEPWANLIEHTCSPQNITSPSEFPAPRASTSTTAYPLPHHSSGLGPYEQSVILLTPRKNEEKHTSNVSYPLNA